MERFIITSVWIVVTILLLAVDCAIGCCINMLLDIILKKHFENLWIIISLIILALVCGVLITAFMFSGNTLILLKTSYI